MRLCLVCDNMIEGKWCKNCHRFVKSYESNSSIYGQEAEPGTAREVMPGTVRDTRN